MEEKDYIIKYIVDTGDAIQKMKQLEAQANQTASNLQKNILGPTGQSLPSSSYTRSQTEQAVYARQQSMFPTLPGRYAPSGVSGGMSSPQISVASGYIAGMSTFQRNIPYSQQLALPNYSQEPLRLTGPNPFHIQPNAGNYQEMARSSIASAINPVNLAMVRQSSAITGPVDDGFSGSGPETSKFGSSMDKLNKKFDMGIIGAKSYNSALFKLAQAEGMTDEQTKKLFKSTEQAGINYQQLAIRAIAVIPIWMALRTAFMAVIQTVQAGVKHIVDFDLALARAKMVLTDVADVSGFMKGLAGEIRTLSTQTGIAAKELAESFYYFGSAGLSADVALAGMNVSAKTSIALMGNLTETSRMLADIYVLLGDKVEGATTPQEKMNYLASSIAVLWKDNTFELNEFTQGIKTFAATASNFNLTVDQMMTLLATSSTLMQRGGAGGTQLSRVFIQLAQKSELAGRYLNEVVDPKKTGYWELFIKVVQKMNTEMQSGIPIMDEIVDIFDIRASKSVAGFAQKFELLMKQLKTATMSPDAKMKEFNEFFETQTDTIDRQLKIMEELKKQTLEAFVIGATGADDYISSLKLINNFIKNTLIPTTIWWGEISREVSQAGSDLVNRVMNPFGKTPQVVAIDDIRKKFSAKQPGVIGTPQGINEEYVNRSKLFEAKLKEFTSASMVEDKKNILTAMGYSEKDAENIALKFADSIQATEYRLGQMYKSVESRTLEQKNKQDVLNKLKAQGLEIVDRERQDLEWKVMMLDRMKIYGVSDIDIQRQKLALQTDSTKIKAEELKLQQMINEEAIKYSGVIQDSLTTSFKDILSGTGGIGGIFTGFNKAITENYRSTVSEGLSSMVMATGIGDLFGGSMSQLKGMFGGVREKIVSAHETVYKWIVKGHQDGLSGAKSSGGVAGNASWTGSSIGGVNTSGLFGGDWWSTPIGSTPVNGGLAGRTASGGYGGLYRPQTQRSGSLTRAQALMGGTQSALTGYSAYQSAQAGGLGVGGSVASGLLAAGGSFAGVMSGIAAASATAATATTAATTGTAAALGLSMGPVGWAMLGVGLVIASMIPSLLGGKEKTSIETKTSETKISSRIDVTNKNLDLINRNLIALRTDIRTYILPSTAYFSSKSSLDEEFSISSRMAAIK